MPYYCTVPRCTSMAGKAKNVSFHQFPRDEELARLWNKILKRGKPYTKYSKVCSLHFRPEDYTITSVGKNKGQWRTLRKDAIPSQNLPSESPGPTPPRARRSGAWVPTPPNVMDPQMQQQMAQAIYMQTMLAMQAATNETPNIPTQLINADKPTDLTTSHPANLNVSDLEQLLKKDAPINGIERLQESTEEKKEQNFKQVGQNITSYKCEECSKCFKDPDVFVLHRRVHTKSSNVPERLPDSGEKENFNVNSDLTRQETLRANPILANLLKSGMTSNETEPAPNTFNNIFDLNNVLSIENQIMAALAANMESYIRNLSSMLHQVSTDDKESDSNNPVEDIQNGDHDSNSHESSDISNEDDSDHENMQTNEDDSDHENMQTNEDDSDHENMQTNEDDSDHENMQANEETHNLEQERHDVQEDDQNWQKESQLSQQGIQIEQVCQNTQGSGSEDDSEPNCDTEDLNESKDSSNLVIDENV